MNEVDYRIEHLIYQVLLQTGVLPTDADAKPMRRYVIAAYFRKLADEPELSRQALVIALTSELMAYRLGGSVATMPQALLAPRRDLACWTQLTQAERDVLYLWKTVGLSEAQIVSELDASGDWVQVAFAKLTSVFEHQEEV